MPDPHEVASALRVSVGLLVRRLRAVDDGGELTMPETAALARLDRGGPVSAAELARAEQISPQSMGVTIGGLLERGLLARSADPADGRRQILALTDAGAAALRSRRTARVARMAQALQEDFTEQELEQLRAAAPLLERLAQRL
jgi:DNA-binding MarR family transcriptional regulator